MVRVSSIFDYGTFQSAYVTNQSGYTRYAVPATLNAPVGARTLEMRFKHWGRGSCVTYDPSSWPIYTFTLQQ
jgi:hypothetical protein